MKQTLSPTMRECIELARASGGELHRHQGGYWASAGPHPLAVRRKWHGSTTVNALVARGYAAWSAEQRGRSGNSYPIAMKLTEKSDG